MWAIYFSQSSFSYDCWQLQVGMWPINLLYRCTGSCFKVFAIWLEAYGLHTAKCQLAGSLRSFPWRMCCPCQQTSSILFFSPMFKLSVINIKNFPLQQTSLFIAIAQPNPDERLFGLTYSSATLHKKLEITQLGFLPLCFSDNWNVKCHKFNKDLELPRLCTLWNENCVAVQGLDLRLMPHRETQYALKARMGEGTAPEGWWVFRKCSQRCFRLFLPCCEDCWKCRDCLEHPFLGYTVVRS